MSHSNLSLIFRAIPDGLPIAGKHLCVEPLPIDLATVPSGGVITRNVHFSLDPYMRLMLPLYCRNLCIFPRLLTSRIAHPNDHADPAIRPIERGRDRRLYARQTSARLIVLPSGLRDRVQPIHWLGVLGMPGLTAYSGFQEVGRPQKGEIAFVSGAAGAVGSTVGQMCKILGLKVIGSAGNAEKVKMLIEELGFDAAFNYKESSTLEEVRRFAPNGIDIYFDNVGGETLDSALANMKKGGRIVACGMVSQYNSSFSTSTSEGQYGVRNLFRFVSKGLTMRGFQVSDPDFGPKYQSQHRVEMLRWLEEGQIIGLTTEIHGVEKAADAFVDMLQGSHAGKTILTMS